MARFGLWIRKHFRLGPICTHLKFSSYIMLVKVKGGFLMGAALAGKKIAVLGGDQREIYLINYLLESGAQVKVLGFENCKEIKGCTFCLNVENAITDVCAIILPMTGLDEKGYIKASYSNNRIQLTENIIQKISNKIPIFVGISKSLLKKWAQEYELNIIETAKIEEIAILNSIPTAEGAIQVAMQETDITLHGSNCVVIGFGKCGKTLARTLDAMGAKTTVIARKNRDLARATEMGLEAFNYDNIQKVLVKADVIFNTVPVLILNKERLSYVKKDALIVDIASKPGGTDFNCTKDLKIKALLALGLPGKVAPKTAGLILSKVIPDRILKEISQPESKKVGGMDK